MKEISTDGRRPVCLTIAGLDPSGGAGIIADIRTFSAFGCIAAGAVSSTTFQNTAGVSGAVHQSADSVRSQIESVLDEHEVAAVKTGMLPTREIVEKVAAMIKERQLRNVVVDPVIRSTSGYELIDPNALTAIIEKLFPRADLITPNIPEAEAIAGIEIDSRGKIEKAAGIMRSMGARNVLIKGGHLSEVKSEKGKVKSEGRIAKDYLFVGSELTTFEAKFVETARTRGTGCMLSSAIAANLALGNDLLGSVRIAKEFVTEAIRSSHLAGAKTVGVR